MGDVPIIGQDEQKKVTSEDITDQQLKALAVEDFFLTLMSKGVLDSFQVLFSADGIGFTYSRFGLDLGFPAIPFDGVMDELSLQRVYQRYVEIKEEFFPEIQRVISSLSLSEDLDVEKREDVVKARNAARAFILRTEIGQILQNRVILLSFLFEEEPAN